MATLTTTALTLIGDDHFAGNAHLTGDPDQDSTSLAAVVQDMQGVLNGVIGIFAGTTEGSRLTIGGGTYGSYTGGHSSWLLIDGTSAPTLDALRFVDQTDGSYSTLTVTGGVLLINGAPV